MKSQTDIISSMRQQNYKLQITLDETTSANELQKQNIETLQEKNDELESINTILGDTFYKSLLIDEVDSDDE